MLELCTIDKITLALFNHRKRLIMDIYTLKQDCNKYDRELIEVLKLVEFLRL